MGGLDHEPAFVFSGRSLDWRGAFPLRCRGVASEKAKSGTDPASVEPKRGAIAIVQKLDEHIGLLEQIALALALLLLIGMGGYQTVATRVLGSKSIWPNELIRYSVFFVATMGAALAAQQARMFAMDAASKKLPKKLQVVLRIVIAALVIVLCYVLAQGGLHARQFINTDHLVLSPTTAVLALPVASGLIGLHYFLHALVDILYLVKGEIPPEKEGVSAH